jgi:peptidoglycan/xylan/chitin deacetylase (PgdA/CDA1 family)
MAMAAQLHDGLILLYHAAFPVVPDAIDVALSNTTPEELSSQFAWLKANFDILEIDTWLSLGDRRGRVAVTFDDGYRSALAAAVPILEALDIAAAFFLNGAMLDGGVFWRDKVRFLIASRLVEPFIRSLPRDCPAAAHLRAADFFETSKAPRVNSLTMEALIDRFLADAGIVIANHCAGRAELPDSRHLVYGSHGYAHPNYASLSAEEARQDIGRNRDSLRRLSLSRARHTGVFALPFGLAESFTAETLAILAEAGYRDVLLADSGWAPSRQEAGPRLTTRLAAPPSLAELQATVAAI